MRKERQRKVLAAVGIFAVVLGGASFAWACTPEAHITAKPSSGPSGSKVLVTGDGFYNGQPVEIRWNSADGPTLATVSNYNWSWATKVTIPQAGEGVYYIVAVTTSEGEVYSPAAAFEVTDSASSRTGGSTSGQTARRASGADGGSVRGEGVTTASGSGADGFAQDEEGIAADTESGADGTGDEAVARQTSKATTSGGSGARGTSGGSESSRVVTVPAASRNTSSGSATTGTPASANAPVVRTDSGQTVFGGSVGSQATQGLSPALGQMGTGESNEGEAPALSDRTGTHDLFSGFSSGDTAVPGLTNGGPASDSPGSNLALGLGLLGAGAVALFGGFVVAQTRRRRALAHTVR